MKMNRLDESKWYFQSNFDESWLPHLQVCFEFSKLPYKIVDEAYDKQGNLIPGQKACYIPREYEESKEHHLFWEYFKQLCEYYRKALIEGGYVTPEEIKEKNMCFYIGCEKRYGIDLSKGHLPDIL